MNDVVKTNAGRTAWDADAMGFGKHTYAKIDPATINPEDYAQSMRGEQTVLGDVREYNSAHNEKHPETDLRLEDLARIGTVFETDYPGHEGTYIVAAMPKVISPMSWAIVNKSDKDGNVIDSMPIELRSDLLGLAVDENNLFPQTRSAILKKGVVGREQRERLTKR